MANTAIRRVPSAAQLNELKTTLSSWSVTASQAAEMVGWTSECLLGDDDYERFGSVDLGDVAQTMQDEIEAFEEPGHCSACNGCGEGQHPGTRCGTCRGRGETPSPREIEQHLGAAA